MICMPRMWAQRAISDSVLPGDAQIFESIQGLLKEPGELVEPEVVAWLYPSGETLGKADMPESTAVMMSDPTFNGNVEKLIRQKDFHQLQAQMQQLRVELEAESKGADTVAEDVLRLQRENTELRAIIARLTPPVTHLVPQNSPTRLGMVQKALMKWITETGYTYIGGNTTDHHRYGLGGRDLNEIKRSLDAMIERGLIKEHKPGFYSLPDWVRPAEHV